MIKSNVLSVLFIFLFSFLHAQTGNELLLQELDNTLSLRKDLEKKKEKKLDSLKKSLEYAGKTQAYVLCNLLMQEYFNYQPDSSLEYARKKNQISELMKHSDYRNQAAMDLAHCMGNTGKYLEALKILHGISPQILSPKLLTYYYYLSSWAYKQGSDICADSLQIKKYARLSQLYEDSLLKQGNTNSDYYQLTKANKLLTEGQAEQLIKELNNRQTDSLDNSWCTASTALLLAKAYHQTGNNSLEKKYYTLAALGNLKETSRNYLPLVFLAQLLCKEGDVSRTCHYLECAMEDPVFCKTYSNRKEIAETLSLLHQTNHVKEERHKQNLLFALVCIVFLFLFFIVAVMYVYHQMKKIAVTKQQLNQLNDSLQGMSEEQEKLQQEINRLKENSRS